MHSSPSRASTQSRRRGFTLVELLVVIGIIAVLISILLPALGNARRSANTAKCAANLRSIVQGVNLYAAQWNGAIPGGPWTSASLINPNAVLAYTGSGTAPTVSDAFTQGRFSSIIAMHDWMSPIAKVYGQKFNEGGTEPDRLERFQKLRNINIFNCPDNQFLTTQFTQSSPGAGLIAPTGLMISYTTAIPFHLRHNRIDPVTGQGRRDYPSGRLLSFDIWNVPSSYNNTIGKLGNPSKKVYIADGGKFSDGTNAPTFNLGIDIQHGGAFADQPPVTGFTRTWGRSRSGTNVVLNTGPTDERTYAYRHGKVKKDARGDTSYKINLAFFDGHVETLGDLEASNPVYWYPKGTELKDIAVVSGGRPQVYPDVRAKYLTGVTGTYIVP